MALEISYWTGYDPITRQVYGRLISSETITTSGTSAQSGTPPSNAAVARCEATTAAVRVANGVASPVASPTNGAYLAAGAWIDIGVASGTKIAAINA